MRLTILANRISNVFNPPVMAFIAFAAINFYIVNNLFLAIAGTMVCWIFNSIIPGIYVLYLNKTGKISHYHVPIREQRTRPYLMAIASYSIGLILLLLLKAPFQVWGLMFCYITNTIVVLSINIKWKISAHAAGLTGALTGTLFALGPLISIFFVLLIPVCWARYYLSAHTMLQLITGSFLGFTLTFFQLGFLGSLLHVAC